MEAENKNANEVILSEELTSESQTDDIDIDNVNIELKARVNADDNSNDFEGIINDAFDDGAQVVEDRISRSDNETDDASTIDINNTVGNGLQFNNDHSTNGICNARNTDFEETRALPVATPRMAEQETPAVLPATDENSNGVRHRSNGAIQNAVIDMNDMTDIIVDPDKSYDRALSVTEIKEQITLTWKDVKVFVDVKSKGCFNKKPPVRKQILKGVSGCVKPGHLVALMGASGAGKSTLLNVLNKRNSGGLEIEGDIRCNGQQLGADITKISAFVQQEDLFMGTMKVREHLWFQALLRLDSETTKEEREARIDSVMKELGLQKCKDVQIGIPGQKKGISGGEMKRLAFASEILTNPPMLFCDEPTSGLDSYMAQSVVQTMADLAGRGKTIICTIHQPSSEVYELFNRILFLSEGRNAYFGPAKGAFPFFAKCGYECPANYNPADYFVHTLAVVPGQEEECRTKVKAICDAYEETREYKEILQDVREAERNDKDIADVFNLKNKQTYKVNWITQFGVVLWRSWLSNFRNPSVIMSKVITTLITALVLGLIYLNQKYDQKGVMNINGVLFLIEMELSFGNVMAVINIFPLEWPIFKRESQNGMYRVDVYFLARTLADVPLFMLAPILSVCISYFMINLYNDAQAFFTAMAVLILVTNTAVSFGYLISCSTDNPSLAVGIAPVVLIPLVMFGGFFLNADTSPPYFIWLQYLSWFFYSHEILTVNQWQGVTSLGCEYVTDAVNSTLEAVTSAVSSDHSASSRCFTNGQEVIESYSFDEGNTTTNFVVLLVLFFGYRALAFFALTIRTIRAK